jgi:hypothetical protein
MFLLYTQLSVVPIINYTWMKHISGAQSIHYRSISNLRCSLTTHENQQEDSLTT